MEMVTGAAVRVAVGGIVVTVDVGGAEVAVGRALVGVGNASVGVDGTVVEVGGVAVAVAEGGGEVGPPPPL